MDKKKVKKSIEQAMDEIIFIGIRHPRLEKQIEEIKECLFEAKEELFKSDWISVEDELPEYWEKVWVTDKEQPNHVWISHREDEKSHRKQDKNGFPLWKFSYPYYEVTHWRKIDKLEV